MSSEDNLRRFHGLLWISNHIHPHKFPRQVPVISCKIDLVVPSNLVLEMEMVVGARNYGFMKKKSTFKKKEWKELWIVQNHVEMP